MPSGTYMYLPIQSEWTGEAVLHIHTSRGHLPLLIQLQWQSQGLKERNEQGSGSRLLSIPNLPYGVNGQFIDYWNRMKKSSHVDNRNEGWNDDVKIFVNNMTDPTAPLSVLSFKAGSLLMDFPDSIWHPAIYGSLFMPNELLDEMYVSSGANTNDVRFASHFLLTQHTLDQNIAAGMRFTLASNLSFVQS